MAKFIFSMQSVLNLRNQTEELKKQEFGEAMITLVRAKEKLDGLIGERDSAVQRFREDITIKIKPGELERYNLYIDLLKKRIAAQRIEVKKAEEFVEIKRAELITATQERKIMEKLKEKKYEEYLEEEKRSEQKIVDEIVSYQYHDHE